MWLYEWNKNFSWINIDCGFALACIILLYHVFTLRIASGDERDRDAYRASDMHNESIECGVPCCVKWSGGGM